LGQKGMRDMSPLSPRRGGQRAGGQIGKARTRPRSFASRGAKPKRRSQDHQGRQEGYEVSRCGGGTQEEEKGPAGAKVLLSSKKRRKPPGRLPRTRRGGRAVSPGPGARGAEAGQAAATIFRPRIPRPAVSDATAANRERPRANRSRRPPQQWLPTQRATGPAPPRRADPARGPHGVVSPAPRSCVQAHHTFCPRGRTGTGRGTKAHQKIERFS